MLLEGCLLAESFTTYRTAVRSLSGMGSFVYRERSFPGECCSTTDALMRSLTRMGHLVPPPIRHVIEAAVAERAFVRLFARMYPSVDAQMLGYLEPGWAKFTSERLILGMAGSHVFLHVPLPDEGFLAK